MTKQEHHKIFKREMVVYYGPTPCNLPRGEFLEIVMDTHWQIILAEGKEFVTHDGLAEILQKMFSRNFHRRVKDFRGSPN